MNAVAQPASPPTIRRPARLRRRPSCTAAGAIANERLAALQHGPGTRLRDPASGALAVLQQRIAGQALLRAFNHNFLLLALLFAGASWLIVLMRRPKPGAAVCAKAAH